MSCFNVVLYRNHPLVNITRSIPWLLDAASTPHDDSMTTSQAIECLNPLARIRYDTPYILCTHHWVLTMLVWLAYTLRFNWSSLGYLCLLRRKGRRLEGREARGLKSSPTAKWIPKLSKVNWHKWIGISEYSVFTILAVFSFYALCL